MLHGLNGELAFPLLSTRRKIKEGSREIPAVEGKTVLITGAGGSIGSEIVRQVAAANPKKILMVDHSEENLYDITCTLQESKLSVPHEGFLADIRSPKSLAKALTGDQRPEVFLHAAALKHVPLLETPFNMLEALRTNVLGTANLVNLAQLIAQGGHDVSFTLVSTDKAVFPTSMMGMTKRLAELVVATKRYSKLKTSVVRFGNVLGSSGSVVPLFRRQIAQGGPVTITDFNMKRYFMTIQQAVSLTLESAAHSESNTPAPLFLFEMGEPVLIKDMAEGLIRQMGLEPGLDIDVIETGIRPGEKLYEDLSYPRENLQPFSDGIQRGRINIRYNHHKTMEDLLAALEDSDLDRAMPHIREMVDISKTHLPDTKE